MPAQRVDFTFATTTPAVYAFILKDESGAAKNYSGSTFKMIVKQRDSSGAPTGATLLTLQTGSNISGAVASGELQLNFAASALAAGDYIYDLARLVAGVVQERIAWGYIDVETGTYA